MVLKENSLCILHEMEIIKTFPNLLRYLKNWPSEKEISLSSFLIKMSVKILKSENRSLIQKSLMLYSLLDRHEMLKNKLFIKKRVEHFSPHSMNHFLFLLQKLSVMIRQFLASSINQIQEIMWDSIAYFSPVSIIDMVEAIENFVSLWKRENNYNALFERYNPENSAKKLLTIIRE